MRIRIYLLLVLSFVYLSCAKPDTQKRSLEMITSEVKQDSVFHNLLKVVGDSIGNEKLNDSLAFLILPIDASCPSCRKKTIDSILKHKETLRERHYIIISANGGIKNIEGYFKEQKGEVPTINKRLFLDSINLSYRLDLCSDRPTIYYTYNRKAYKKVAAVPVTVRDDLREFFSGHRK